MLWFDHPSPARRLPILPPPTHIIHAMSPSGRSILNGCLSQKDDRSTIRASGMRSIERPTQGGGDGSIGRGEVLLARVGGVNYVEPLVAQEDIAQSVGVDAIRVGPPVPQQPAELQDLPPVGLRVARQPKRSQDPAHLPASPLPRGRLPVASSRQYSNHWALCCTPANYETSSLTGAEVAFLVHWAQRGAEWAQVT